MNLPDHHLIVTALGLIVLASPACLLVVLGGSALVGIRPREQSISRLCQTVNIVGLLASLGVLALMLIDNTRYELIPLGEWVVISKYHFSINFMFDRLSVPFAILSFILCGTIGAFASRYMHREPGYHRFFVVYAMFETGMIVTSLAGTVETLFAGWEFVGLSSVLLVAYFQERPAPAQNALHIWVVYRVADAALLLAALVMHHLKSDGNFNELLSGGPWPEGLPTIHESHALAVGLLVLVAAAGKSALVPFSGWLPRAMEGPTPTSAIFYGALSVHLGAFLLLRFSPLLDVSQPLSSVVVVIGLTTAVYAYLVGSVQTDIKSALCFASLVQVGIVVAEIGLGFRYVALTHLLGNACLRTLQLIRAPSLLRDYHLLENAIGDRLEHNEVTQQWLPHRIRTWLYRFALERGYLDTLLLEWFVRPVVRAFTWFDSLERRWLAWISPPPPARSAAESPLNPFEDLP